MRCDASLVEWHFPGWKFESLSSFLLPAWTWLSLPSPIRTSGLAMETFARFPVG